MRSFAFALVVVGCSSPRSAITPDATPIAPDAPDLPVPPVGNIQMNDLSVLLPLAATQAEFATYLSATALVPQVLYNDNGETAGAVAYDQLRVIALRFDPCFAQLAPTASCHNQLRLVFQPLQLGADGTIATDAAVHVSYAITRAQLVTAVNEIAAAREVTTTGDLGPLAVNSIIASQGLTGAMAERVRAVIVEYADSAKIERITSFVANPNMLGRAAASTPVFWEFDGIDVAAGVSTTLLIPTLDDTVGMSLNVTTDPLESLFGPSSSSPDNIELIASADQATAATATARAAAFDAALRIENPRSNTANTIDCASCHMAEPARRLVGEQMFGFSAVGDVNAFAADPSIPGADLVTTTTLVDPDTGLDIHAFSYRGTSPMINQRVVNETAATLSYLESL